MKREGRMKRERENGGMKGGGMNDVMSPKSASVSHWCAILGNCIRNEGKGRMKRER